MPILDPKNSKALAELRAQALASQETHYNFVTEMNKDKKYIAIRKDMQDEIDRLESEVSELLIDLDKNKTHSEQYNELLKELQAKVDSRDKEKDLLHLLPKVCAEAQDKLKQDSKFRLMFEKECEAFVMSADIRRSTELMLKALTPKDFADFITELCDALVEIVKVEYGVFDKFTGDGILCFFPIAFSGQDAGKRAVRAAAKCHKSFRRIYRKHYERFSTVLMDVGLGIGIDFGKVTFVKSFGGLTVVGRPVVYACRLGAAPKNTTLISPLAYRELWDKCSASFKFKRTKIEIKSEGQILAYKVSVSESRTLPALPNWCKVNSESIDPEGQVIPLK